jgi:hypothetical protein
MSERRNTLVCCFDPASPRLTAYDIHEWIHSQLQILEHSVSMIQIDGIRRQVFIKFIDISTVHDILRVTNGETVYKHVTGEISPVRLIEAGMGPKRVRLANLPPEILNNNIRIAMSHYGNVQAIQEETWAKHYRYKVSSGVKIVHMTLTKHIPSYLIIDGHRTITSYEGQPQTCYGCGESSHMYHACPKRRMAKATTPAPENPTWADITAAKASSTVDHGVPDNNNMVTDSHPQTARTVSPVHVDDTLEQMESAPSDGRTDGHEESRIDKITTQEQARDPPTPTKWADEVPDLERVPSVDARPLSSAPAADKDWPTLPITDMGNHSDTELHKTLYITDGGEKKPITSTEDFEIPSDATASQDVSRSEMIRNKKMRLEKSRENSRERKRSRTRHATTVKEKH